MEQCDNCAMGYSCIEHDPVAQCRHTWKDVSGTTPHRCIKLIGRGGSHCDGGGHYCCCGSGEQKEPI